MSNEIFKKYGEDPIQLCNDWLNEAQLQNTSPIGHGEARLARSRDIIRVVTDHLTANETAFLHPKGHDEECDDAWLSLENI